MGNAIPKRILAIDDDLNFLRALETALADKAKLTFATTEKEFSERFKPEDFDAVITDYEMNLWNGLEVIQKVKAARPDLPIILVSGIADKAIVIKCANMNVHRIIEKPIQLTEIYEAIDSAFSGQKKFETEKVSSYGPMRFIADTFRIGVGSNFIQLTETEFKIFRILAEKPERRIDRDTFLKKLWGNHRVSDHTFDTHLVNLKRKIPELKVLIKNIRGHGYVLTAYEEVLAS